MGPRGRRRETEVRRWEEKVNDIRKRERKKSERVGGGEGKGDVGVEGRWEEV